MFELFILLFNLGAFVVLLFFSLKIAKLIKEKYGKAAAVIFVLFILFTKGRSGNNSGNKDSKSRFETTTWEGRSIKTLAPGIFDTSITLEKNWYSRLSLRVVGKNDTLKDSMSLEAYTIFSGWQAGGKITRSSVYLHRIGDSNDWRYIVSVYENWYLFGLSFYTSDDKDFDGTISNLRFKNL